jgi:hypothetical protein
MSYGSPQHFFTIEDTGMSAGGPFRDFAVAQALPCANRRGQLICRRAKGSVVAASRCLRDEVGG